MLCKDIKDPGQFLGEKFMTSYTFVDGQGNVYPRPTAEYSKWFMQTAHFQLAIYPAWFVTCSNDQICIRPDPTQAEWLTVDWLERNFPGFMYDIH